MKNRHKRPPEGHAHVPGHQPSAGGRQAVLTGLPALKAGLRNVRRGVQDRLDEVNEAAYERAVEENADFDEPWFDRDGWEG